MIFTFSIALGYIATNLDGLLLFVALSSVSGHRRTLAGFLIAQTIILTMSYTVGSGASLLPIEMIGMLGIVPIGLGVYALWQDYRQSGEEHALPRGETSIIALTATFLSISLDTFVLMAAFFADSAASADTLVLLGGLIAVATLLIVGTTMARTVQAYDRLAHRLMRFAPFVMIIAGIYIVLDTSTDMF